MFRLFLGQNLLLYRGGGDIGGKHGGWNFMDRPFFISAINLVGLARAIYVSTMREKKLANQKSTGENKPEIVDL